MEVFLGIGAIGIILLLVFLLIGEVGDLLSSAEGIGSGWFSGGALAGFLGALGFVGAMVLALTDSVGIAVVAGVFGGVAFGALAGWLTNLLRKGDAGAPRSSSVVGQVATVLHPIPEAGYGAVNLVVNGQITRLNARCSEPLPAGSEVVITAVLSPTSVMVEPMYVLGARDPLDEL